MCEIPLDYVDAPRSAGSKSLVYRPSIASRAGGGDHWSPVSFWLGGFASDMSGSKAQFVDESGKEKRPGVFTELITLARGASKGKFIDGSISDWLERSLSLFHQSTQGPQISNQGVLWAHGLRC